MGLKQKLEKIEKLLDDPIVRKTVHPGLLTRIQNLVNNLHNKLTRDKGLDEATTGSLANSNVTVTDVNEDKYITGRNEFPTIGKILDEVTKDLEKVQEQSKTIDIKNDKDPVKPLAEKKLNDVEEKLEEVNEMIDALQEQQQLQNTSRRGFD